MSAMQEVPAIKSGIERFQTGGDQGTSCLGQKLQRAVHRIKVHRMPFEHVQDSAANKRKAAQMLSRNPRWSLEITRAHQRLQTQSH
jgi:hypothetical protein